MGCGHQSELYHRGRYKPSEALFNVCCSPQFYSKESCWPQWLHCSETSADVLKLRFNSVPVLGLVSHGLGLPFPVGTLTCREWLSVLHSHFVLFDFQSSAVLSQGWLLDVSSGSSTSQPEPQWRTLHGVYLDQEGAVGANLPTVPTYRGLLCIEELFTPCVGKTRCSPK